MYSPSFGMAPYSGVPSRTRPLGWQPEDAVAGDFVSPSLLSPRKQTYTAELEAARKCAAGAL